MHVVSTVENPSEGFIVDVLAIFKEYVDAQTYVSRGRMVEVQEALPRKEWRIDQLEALEEREDDPVVNLILAKLRTDFGFRH